MGNIFKHWIEVTGIRGDGFVCEECNYFVRKGESLTERCPACRSEMSQQVLQLTLLDDICKAQEGEK